MDLSVSDFSEFFQAIHGYHPFPWQENLLNTLAQNDQWPDMLDLPTGTGKTATLDIAVFHLALRVDAPWKAALRIVFVVDRRLVVDDTFARAQKIENVLSSSLSKDFGVCSVVKEVARRLKILAGEENRPLVAQRLRGGAPLEHDWARTPTQPTILCSTVDQIGSRLLFRGYGVSDRMKPLHAGLLGINSLILLDEAHLSEPFRQTLEAIRKLRYASTNTKLPALKLVALSATPGNNALRPFTLSAQDRANPELKKRLYAKKTVEIKLLRKERDREIAKMFAEETHELIGRLQEQKVFPTSVGVIVNRVNLARNIYEQLSRMQTESENQNSRDIDLVLLIGPSRSVDRDELVNRLKPFRTGANCRSDAKSIIIVATQCLEVGVDIDLDGLVSQAASLDALRQRFGRLNRAGRPIHARGKILAPAEDVGKRSDDPVYGDRIRTTWDKLKNITNQNLLDFGIEALSSCFRDAGIELNDLAIKRYNAPVVMPAYLDLWSQTWPRPIVDPDISLFLHGAERITTGVYIVWRHDISESDLKNNSNQDNLKKLMHRFPPRVAEAIEVPLKSALGWLSRAEQVSDNISDVPYRVSDSQDVGSDQSVRRRVFLWAGPDDPRTGIAEIGGFRPGDFLVVPSSYGGCDKFGWAPNSEEPVKDVADKAAEPYLGRRIVLRITRNVVNWAGQWGAIANIIASKSTDVIGLIDALMELLPEIQDKSENHRSDLHDIHNSLEEINKSKRHIVVLAYDKDDYTRGILIDAKKKIELVKAKNTTLPTAPTTEDDTASSTLDEPVSIDDHCSRVTNLVERFAQRLCLDSFVDDLKLAAFLHDAGKASPRFQIMLSGGDFWNRPDGPALAKSGCSWQPYARVQAGLSEGWRHEALSVRMARVHPQFIDANDPALVLWLIGSHHGYGRPFFSFLDSSSEKPLPCLNVKNWNLSEDQSGPNSLAFDLDGDDWPSLFKSLKNRYGIWELAHLESILRLADHRASEEESEL